MSGVGLPVIGTCPVCHGEILSDHASEQCPHCKAILPDALVILCPIGDSSRRIAFSPTPVNTSAVPQRSLLVVAISWFYILAFGSSTLTGLRFILSSFGSAYTDCSFLLMVTGLVSAIGLLKGYEWARRLFTIVLSILACAKLLFMVAIIAYGIKHPLTANDLPPRMPVESALVLLVILMLALLFTVLFNALIIYAVNRKSIRTEFALTVAQNARA